MVKRIVAVSLAMCLSSFAMACPDFLTGEYRKLNSQATVDMCELTKNKAVLVVNTASHCGFTGQLKSLEKLYQDYGNKGLVIIGFPSNDFKQEADSEEKAAKVCFANNGVSFTMLAPSSVKGENANKVFAHLGKVSQSPGWNFNKYLINANGDFVSHFGSRVKPNSKELIEKIELSLPK
ncbi:MAG: glutathione peroxidase [Cellvibrio sp.]